MKSFLSFPHDVLHRALVATMVFPLAGVLLSGCGGGEKFADDSGNSTTNAVSNTVTAGRDEPASKPGKYGGSLTEATLGDPKGFNLWTSTEASTSEVVGPLYEPFITRNAYTLEWEPALAELPKVSEDGLTWTFDMKPGLKWSDGRPITIDDAIFTLDVIFDPKISTNFVEGMKVDIEDPVTKKVRQEPIKYRKVDADTIEFKFPVPYAPAREMLSFSIAPKHKLEAAYKAGKFNQTWGINTPVSELVSSGPWIITEFKAGQRIVYGRNPNYWKKDEQGRPLPYLDKYILLAVKDQNAMTINFENGDTDTLGPIPQPDYPRIKKGEGSGNYTVHALGPGWGFSYIGFNMNPNSSIDKWKVKLFQDVRFRRAVSHLVNRPLISKNLYLGMASPLFGPQTPANSLFYNPDVPKYEYDPQKAKALFQEIGLRDSNGNKFLEFEGKEVKFNIITNVENNLRRATSAIIADDLKKAGINATFTPINFNTLVNYLSFPPYKWEAIVLGFTGGPEPHTGRNIWNSAGNLHQWWPKQKQPATKWEEEIDILFRKGAQTLDQAERKKIYDRWQVIAAEQLPFIYTVVPDTFVAIRNRYGNLKPTPLGALWNMEEIYDLEATRDRP